MGVVKFFSSSIFDPFKYEKAVDNKNPDPKNWSIKEHVQINSFLIIKINYPDCTNYEGNKILVFENTTMEELMKQKMIDPHFSGNKKFLSPFARFEPTEKGWEAAIKLSESLS